MLHHKGMRVYSEHRADVSLWTDVDVLDSDFEMR
jgi:hypothetical protein